MEVAHSQWDIPGPLNVSSKNNTFLTFHGFLHSLNVTTEENDHRMLAGILLFSWKTVKTYKARTLL